MTQQFILVAVVHLKAGRVPRMFNYNSNTIIFYKLLYIYFLLLVYNQRIYSYHSRCYSIVHSLSKGVALQRPKNTVSSASDLLQLLSSEHIYKKEEPSKEVSVNINNNSNLYYTLHYRLQYLTFSVQVEVHLHLQYIIHCNT